MAATATELEMQAEEVQSAALQLPREARARLAARLLESLEEESRWDRLWAAEVQERVRAVKAGEMKTIPLEEALKEARDLLR